MARKSFQASYVELRHKTYYAVYYIPKPAQLILGKTKFSKSTQTGDLATAEDRAAILVAQWKQQVASALNQSPDPLIEEALVLSKHHSNSSEFQRLITEDVIDERSCEIELKSDEYVASMFSEIAKNKTKPLITYIPDWINHEEKRGLAKKTIDLKVSDLEVLTKSIPTLNYLTESFVKVWMGNLCESGAKKTTIQRIVRSCKSFFEYLQYIGAEPDNKTNPFVLTDYARLKISIKTTSSKKHQQRTHFSTEEIEKLYNNAIEDNDKTLSYIIKIGAYTGARLDEICSLRTNSFNPKQRSITIVDAKTNAGNRTIPVHSELIPLLEQLSIKTTNIYLFDSLTEDKYGKRSNAIAKKFSRLKTKLGFGEEHVFHSIRKTVTTLLENSGVPENIAADIVGHKKHTMTYGVYSGGATLEVMREAIEKISFNFA